MRRKRKDNHIEEDMDMMVKYLVFIEYAGRSAWSGEVLPPDFHAHHFIHRKDKLFRWDLRNVFPLLKEEHFKLHNGMEGQFGADMSRMYPRKINGLLADKMKPVERAGRSFIANMYDTLKKRFEDTIGDFEEFKKLDTTDRWRKCLEIVRNNTHEKP